MDSAGFNINKTPTIEVTIPKAKDHPQLSNCSLFASENTISENPPNKKEMANNKDNASNELAGQANDTTLTTMKNIPTNNGMYQCLMVFFNDFNKDNSIFIFLIFILFKLNFQ